MKIKYTLAAVTLMQTLCVPAHSGMVKEAFEAIENHTEVCSKYTTPDQKEHCRQKDMEKGRAERRYWEQANEKHKAAQPQFNKPLSDKPSGLCFTRKATGEVVCPN